MIGPGAGARVMVATRRSIVRPLGDGIQTLSVMATGDLTVRMSGEYTGDLGLLKESINTVGRALEDALVKVSATASRIHSAWREISARSAHTSAG